MEHLCMTWSMPPHTHGSRATLCHLSRDALSASATWSAKHHATRCEWGSDVSRSSKVPQTVHSRHGWACRP
jgi:hypothetical protein